MLAAAFAYAGARVCLVARSREKLDEVRSSLPGQHMVCAGSVTESAFNEQVADAVMLEHGRLDVWICNAGISPVFGGPGKVTAEQWREVIDVNLTGPFLGAKAAARVMANGGRIIMTASVLGERPKRGLSAYSASKAGLIGLTKALALDLAGIGITVNAVVPGWFYSRLAGDYRKPEYEEGILAHTALRRWGTGADLPAACMYLASSAASFVTGAVLAVDGGYLLA